MNNTNLVKWEDVSISNDFMFGKVMQNPNLCKKLLQIIFPKLQIDHIEYPETQKTVENDLEAHGIRIDVYVKDEAGMVYTIEMQAADTKQLPQRSRYYHSMVDLQLLDRGESYAKLNQSYVIFICTFDLFGTGRHVYTFENICLEDTDIHLEDGTTKIFLNANGTMDDVDANMKAFLDYVAGKKSDSDFVKELEEAVREAKKNREWRRQYVNLYMRDLLNREKGREEGREEGESRILVKIVESVMRKKGVDLETACDMGDVTVEEYYAAKKLIGEVDEI